MGRCDRLEALHERGHGSTKYMTAGLGDDLNSDKKLVLVCYAGKRYAQAGTTCLALIGANMDNVLPLEGGFGEWSKVYPDIVEK